MIVYKTINLINGLIYVGKDSNNDFLYLGSGVKLLEAIKEFGKENFRKETLCTCGTVEVLCKMEIFYINKFDARNPKTGYNVHLGGKGNGVEMTQEVRGKLSIAARGRRLSEKTKKKISESNLGRKVSEETREKIGIKNGGKKFSKDHRRKLSRAKMGKNHPNYGKHLSKEVRNKISKSNKGHKVSEETRNKMSESAKGNKSALGCKH